MSEPAKRSEDIPSRGVKVQRIDEPLRCAMGHQFTDNVGILGHGWRQCAKREGDGSRPTRCGEVIYVVNFCNGTRGVVRVDWREAARMEKLQLSINEVAHFLHLPWRSGMP